MATLSRVRHDGDDSWYDLTIHPCNYHRTLHANYDNAVNFSYLRDGPSHELVLETRYFEHHARYIYLPAGEGLIFTDIDNDGLYFMFDCDIDDFTWFRTKYGARYPIESSCVAAVDELGESNDLGNSGESG